MDRAPVKEEEEDGETSTTRGAEEAEAEYAKEPAETGREADRATGGEAAEDEEEEGEEEATVTGAIGLPPMKADASAALARRATDAVVGAAAEDEEEEEKVAAGRATELEAEAAEENDDEEDGAAGRVAGGAAEAAPDAADTDGNGAVRVAAEAPAAGGDGKGALAPIGGLEAAAEGEEGVLNRAWGGGPGGEEEDGEEIVSSVRRSANPPGRSNTTYTTCGCAGEDVVVAAGRDEEAGKEATVHRPTQRTESIGTRWCRRGLCLCLSLLLYLCLLLCLCNSCSSSGSTSGCLFCSLQSRTIELCIPARISAALRGAEGGPDEPSDARLKSEAEVVGTLRNCRGYRRGRGGRDCRRGR